MLLSTIQKKIFLILCVREQVWKPVNRWIENFYNNESAAAARKCLGSQCNNFSPSTTSRPPPLTNVQLPRRTKTTTTNTVLPLINHPLVIICRVVNIYPTGNERTNERKHLTYLLDKNKPQHDQIQKSKQNVSFH